MTPLLNFLANYLLNALWQLPLLFAVAWLLGFALRRLGPLAEHRLWAGTLLVQCLLPACSAPQLAAALSQLMHRGEQTGGSVTITVGALQPVGLGSPSAAWFHAVEWTYAAVTAFFFVRLVWQWVRLRHLIHNVQPVALSPEDAVSLQSHLSKLPHKSIHIAVSPAVHAPLTFGLRLSWLLLPKDFVATVDRGQLRAALLHELAHIRRHDYAKHLLYRILSLPLAWHPVLWLTLARVVATREEVCDRLAANQTGDPRHYADALLALASKLAQHRPAHAHAIGIFDANRLERRILMLRKSPPAVSPLRRVAILTAAAVLALTTGASALALRLHIDPPHAAPAAAGDPVKVKAAIMASEVVSKVQPKYPEAAKKAKIQGAVLLSAVIGKDGTIQNLTVLSGPEELRASALAAVRQWVYKPYLLNGEPTEVETTITINYSLGDEAPATPQSAAIPEAQSARPVPPKLLAQVFPDYPAEAKRNRISGEVIVSANIGRNGKVDDAAAISGPPELRAAATNAVSRYVFSPATLHGDPVPVNLHVAVKFESF